MPDLINHDVHDVIVVQVNGKLQQCLPQTGLLALFDQMGLNPRLIAVEYNGEILHRQYWQDTVLQPGDRLEIVTIVGGG
ncbi:MAG: sulfur carrier protein ThiS [Cyanobacteria bacterium]|nr:sulfur carrier protein ThiS [Cyanobacteriota bacterium]MDW8201807.1 sulfur carrier protein ThiS [Cyanobacteriota bacterium SKYGB_h_bin112]